MTAGSSSSRLRSPSTTCRTRYRRRPTRCPTFIASRGTTSNAHGRPGSRSPTTLELEASRPRSPTSERTDTSPAGGTPGASLSLVMLTVRGLPPHQARVQLPAGPRDEPRQRSEEEDKQSRAGQLAEPADEAEHDADDDENGEGDPDGVRNLLLSHEITVPSQVASPTRPPNIAANAVIRPVKPARRSSDRTSFGRRAHTSVRRNLSQAVGTPTS